MTGRHLRAPLHVRIWPSPANRPGPPLALLHGFTQNSDCWGRFGDRLAETNPLLAVDAPGHGRSGHDDADLWRTADLVATTIEARWPGHERDRPVVIGYSMGGRTALHLALAHPRTMSGLVLIGATAGIDDSVARAARRTDDHRLATRIESTPLPEFMDWWLSNPLFAGLTPVDAARAERLANRPAGLAASLRHCGTGSQEPLWDRMNELTMPVLLIAGRQDPKFTALADRMAASMTAAEAQVVTVEGHHAVHLENPADTVQAVTRWVNRR